MNEVNGWWKVIYTKLRKARGETGKLSLRSLSNSIRGRTLYFNKKDLVALNTELKKRNIDLSRYIELQEDKAKFQKYIESLKDPKKSMKRQRFKIPDDLKDIVTYPYHHPPREVV
ncbi:MAG: hypothetical protein IPF54_05430 [Draconibacterium sp.]|nr:hypothetical protein [Draconibacterium sp.]